MIRTCEEIVRALRCFRDVRTSETFDGCPVSGCPYANVDCELAAMQDAADMIDRLANERDALKSGCITKQDALALVKQYARAWAKEQNEFDGTCALLKDLYDDIKGWDSFCTENSPAPDINVGHKASGT